MIGAGPGASAATLHFTLIFAFVISDRLKVLPDGAFVIVDFYGFHAVSGEEGLVWPVELTFDGIAAGPYTILGMLDRFNQVRRSHCP